MTDKELIERLRATHLDQTSFGGVRAGAYHTMPKNPDGPAAASRIEALIAERDRAYEEAAKVAEGCREVNRAVTNEVANRIAKRIRAKKDATP